MQVGLYGVALLSLGSGALLVGLCCLCCLGRCAQLSCARRRRLRAAAGHRQRSSGISRQLDDVSSGVAAGAAGGAGGAEGLQMADARCGDELASPSVGAAEQAAAAPAPAARRRLASRMEAAGTAKLLDAELSDAAGY